MKRSELREHIFKMVFGIEFRPPEEMPEQLGLYFEQLENPREQDLDYIRQKAQKVAKKAEEIDALLNEKASGWDTGRMSKVDLTILRLAVYEICYDEEVPTGVAINEAVELAKKFGQDASYGFVNGVLAKFA